MPTSLEEFWADWVWGICIHGFCVSLLRPALIGFFFLVIAFEFGSGLGKLPLLFWRPRPPVPLAQGGTTTERRTRPHKLKQIFIGLVVGALFWQVFLSGYIFEEFATNFTYDRAPLCEAREGAGGEWKAITTDPEHYTYKDKRYSFPNRFRHDPQAWLSMWLYVGAAFTGLVILTAIAALAYFVLRGLTVIVWWVRGWHPTRRTGAEVKAANRDRPPKSLWLPLGIIGGMLLASGVTVFWVKVTPDFSRDFGMRMLRHAGWGRSAERQAKLRAHINSAPAPDEKESAEAQRTWYLPYAPVYAAFILNFYAFYSVLLVLFLVPLRWRLFSPAIGIVFLCSILLYAHVRLTYFVGFPAEHALLLLFGATLLFGRAYKLRFPNLEAYYRKPSLLSDHYEARARAEATEVVAEVEKAAREQAQKAAQAERVKLAGAAAEAVVEVEEAAREQAQNVVPAERMNPDGAATVAEARAADPVANWTLLDSNKIRYPHTNVGRPGAKAPPLVIVCVSGGGSRAAAWTVKVLSEIEKAFLKPTEFNWESAQVNPPAAMHAVRFPYHVRLVTGASGGMIGAAQYVANLDEPAPLDPERPVVNRHGPLTRQRDGTGVYGSTPLTLEHLFDGVCDDFLTPIVHTLIFRDMLSLLSPRHLFGTDRGGTLEDAWLHALHGQLDHTFTELQPGEAAGWRPSLIFSPMLVEDGRQLFISNLELSRVVRNTARLLGENFEPNEFNPTNVSGRRLLSREGLEFFKVFPKANAFRVSTAARMSASFPYVLPAVPLPTDPPRRVVDAGYYDNYGVGIAASWLFSYSKWVREHTGGVVVIQIRDGVSGRTRRREQVPDSAPSLPAAALHWLTSPPAALWHFRQAAHTFRNDNLIHQLDAFFRAEPLDTFPTAPADPVERERFRSEFFTTVTFELQQGDDVALNFALTEGERNTIVNDAESAGFKHQLASLLKWWHSR